MSIDEDALRAELNKLRRLAGARSSQLLKPNPQLTAVCGIVEADTPGQRRRKLTTMIDLLSPSPEGKELLLVALGLHDRARQPTLERRLEWLSRESSESVNTLRRRLSKEIEYLARAAAAAPRVWSVPPDVGYAIEALVAVETIDGARTNFLQRRKISVVKGGLRKIKCRFQIDPPPEGEAEPSFAFRSADGVLGEYEVRRCGPVLECDIRLPRALSAGEVYEVEARYVLPTDRLKPFYVVHPKAPIGSVEITVTFDPLRVPDQVWSVDGIEEWRLEDQPPADKLLRPDPSGRVRADFPGTREGRAYGLVWRWAES